MITPWTRKRALLALIVALIAYLLLAWLPDGDISDAHYWALLVALVLWGTILLGVRR